MTFFFPKLLKKTQTVLLISSSGCKSALTSELSRIFSLEMLVIVLLPHYTHDLTSAQREAPGAVRE